MAFKKITLKIITMMLFLFLLSTIGIAEDYKKIKDDWFYNDEVFQIGTDIYDLLIQSNNIELLRFKKNEYTTLISVNQCKTHEDFKFCYENYSYDKKADINDKGELMPGIHLIIYQSQESVDPSHSIDVSSSISGNKFVFEEQEAIITLENTGDLSLTGSEIRIIAPTNTSITSRGDFIQVSNTLRKTLTLPINDDIELIFNYKVLSIGKKDFAYEIIKDDEEIKTGTLSVSGILPYDVKVETPSTSDIRQNQNINIIIENENPSNALTVKELIVRGSPYFQYLVTTDLSSFRVGSFSAYDVEISPSNKKTFSLKYRPLFAGKYDFTITGIIEQLGEEHTFSDFKELNVKSESLSAGLLFSRKKISLGAENSLVLTLKNDHSTLSFNDIEVKIESSLINETKTIETIIPGEEIKLLDEKIVPPQKFSNEKYEATATLSYSDASGSAHSLTLADFFEVLGNSTLLRISQSVSPKKVSAGDEVIIKVKVRNLIDNSFREVIIKDFFSQSVEVITGRNTYDSHFSGGQEREVYLYKIKIPERPTSDTLEIKTSAEIPGLNYEQEETTIVEIEGDIYWDEAETETEAEDVNDIEETEYVDGEELEQESEDEEKKEGFFRRFARNLGNFFSRLFGR